jgi:hypothetical protein
MHSAVQQVDIRTDSSGGSAMKHDRTASAFGRFCPLGFSEADRPVSASN